MQYSALKTKLKAWLRRGTDLDSYLNDFINGAIWELERTYNFDHMGIRKSNISVALGDSLVTIPTEFSGIKNIKWAFMVDSSGKRLPMRVEQEAQAIYMSPDLTNDKNEPSLISIIDTATRTTKSFLIRPTASYACTLDISANVFSTELSGDTDTNAWTDSLWPLTLWASCMQASPYLINDDRIPMWERKMERALQLAIKGQKSAKMSGPGQYVKPYVVDGGI